MPRQPTGTPRGRPRGSGLGVGDEAPRLTVRLPPDLYTRLEAFAEQYRYHRGDPPLAGCVREMVTFCLDHPDLFRQPRNVPDPPQDTGESFRQSKNNPHQVVQWHSIDARQPGNIPVASEGTGDIFRQPENTTSPVPQGHRTHYRQPENCSTFDTTRFFLGELCSEAHRYQGQAHSLRYLSGDQNCVTCRRERNRRYNAAKRERQTWQQTTPQRG